MLVGFVVMSYPAPATTTTVFPLFAPYPVPTITTTVFPPLAPEISGVGSLNATMSPAIAASMIVDTVPKPDTEDSVDIVDSVDADDAVLPAPAPSSAAAISAMLD